MLIKTIIERLSSIVAVSSLAYLHGFIGWKNVTFLRSVALRQNGWDNRSTLSSADKACDSKGIHQFFELALHLSLTGSTMC